MLSDMFKPSQSLAAVSALWLAALGLFYLLVLVANWSDNAYLWLFMIGALLILVSIPFALAALLPYNNFRRIVIWLSIGLLWLFGAFSSVMLIGALFIIPSQHYPTPQVFVSHLVGLLVLLPTLFFVGYRFVR